MSQTISNRYEILFLYEARDCNPNGDPLDENRPRTDPATGQVTVTDVRIKRTIRDFLLNLEQNVEKRCNTGMEILIRDTLKADGYLSEGKDRADAFKPKDDDAAKGKKKKGGSAEKVGEEVLKQCIDARLFGCALPLGKGEQPLQITGPVQFMPFNRSLNRVNPQFVRQTAAFAGDDDKKQKTWAERWLLPYALIGVYGVANENSARTSKMTEADFDLMLKALWRGTADLNTHSKIGHDPLLLLVVKSAPGFKIGALQTRIHLAEKQVEDEALRSTEQYKLDVSGLVEALKASPNVEEIKVLQDKRLVCTCNGKDGLFAQLADVPKTSTLEL